MNDLALEAARRRSWLTHIIVVGDETRWTAGQYGVFLPDIMWLIGKRRSTELADESG